MCVCEGESECVCVCSQGSVCEDGSGLDGGHKGWGKCLYISGPGPCGGDGIGVSGEAAGGKAEMEFHFLLKTLF